MSKALDDEKILARLEELDAAFDADPIGFIEATKGLTGADYRLIGHIIQLYCYADLSARRAIDAIREAALGPNGRNASTLKEAQVFPKLREAALMLWDMNIKETLIRAADILTMHSSMRHNFAHWAVRRIPRENAYILLSRYATEAKRRHGLEPDPYTTSYGIGSLATLKVELRKLDGHGHNLSVAAYELENRVAELRLGFDERNMHPVKRQSRPL